MPLKITNAPIQWLYLNKTLEALGGWPGNALESKCTATVRPLFSSQCKFSLCGKCLYRPSHCTLHHKWMVDELVGVLHDTKNHKQFPPHWVPCHCWWPSFRFPDSCDGGYWYHHWQWTVWLGLQMFVGNNFANLNLSVNSWNVSHENSCSTVRRSEHPNSKCRIGNESTYVHTLYTHSIQEQDSVSRDQLQCAVVTWSQCLHEHTLAHVCIYTVQ